MPDDMNRDNKQDENKHKGSGNPGNFANDPERAREAGRKGGQA